MNSLESKTLHINAVMPSECHPSDSVVPWKCLIGAVSKLVYDQHLFKLRDTRGENR